MGDEDRNAGPVTKSSKRRDDALSSEVMLELQVSLETISNLSFLAHQCTDHPEKAKAYLRMLDEQVERMAGIMRTVLRPPKGQ